MQDEHQIQSSDRGDSDQPWVRFFDSFLSEKNIKWLLGTGVFLLFGSSLMLVTNHWENLHSAAKYLTILGYTSVIWICGELVHKRLKLFRTGKFLLSLSLLLFPLTWVVLALSVEGQGWALSLLALQCAISLPATYRVLNFFLRGFQPTFYFAYSVLSIVPYLLESSLIPSGLQFSMGNPLGFSVVWAVFFLGTIKVNRHVFWLAEEHRLPRVFGFFPITLLGGQFLFITTGYFNSVVSMPWWGLLSALTGLVIAKTAGDWIRVHQNRTGSLVRPLPWIVILPCLVTLLLSGAGIGLAGYGIVNPQLSAYALVPTALVATLSLLLFTHWLKNKTLTWGALITATIAYNFSPVFFLDLARKAIDIGAQTVREDRLPFAFYGLTYLPFLLGLSLLRKAFIKKNADHLHLPITRFTTILSILLSALSLTHTKAIFPVSIALLVLHGTQVILFKKTTHAWLTLISLTLAAYGFHPFVEQFFELTGDHFLMNGTLFNLAFAALTMVALSPWLDPHLRALSHSKSALSTKMYFSTWAQSPCQTFSVILTLFISGIAIFHFFDQSVENNTVWLLSGLLFVQAYRTQSGLLGKIANGYLFLSGGQWLYETLELSLGQVIDITLVVCIGLWFINLTLKLKNERILQTIIHPNRSVLEVVLETALICVAIPSSLVYIFNPVDLNSFMLLSSITQFALIAWSLIASIKNKRAFLPWFSFIALALFASELWIQYAPLEFDSWLMAVLAVLCLPFLKITSLIQLKEGESEDTNQAYKALKVYEKLSTLLLVLLGMGSLIFFQPAFRVAALVSVFGLLISSRMTKTSACFFLQIQCFALIVNFLQPEALSILDYSLFTPEMLKVTGALSLVSVINLAITTALGKIFDTTHSLINKLQRTLFRSLSIFFLMIGLIWAAICKASLADPDQVIAIGHGFNLWSFVISSIVIAILEFKRAADTRETIRVWTGCISLSGTIGFLLLTDVLNLTIHHLFFVSVILGSLAMVISLWRQNRATEDPLVQPFRIIGFLLPLNGIFWAVRSWLYGDLDWSAFHTLSMFTVAMTHFYVGVSQKQGRHYFYSGLLTNISLLILFFDLGWNSLELFMVPAGLTILGCVRVFKNELPKKFHNPLRYLGALTILVSPVFEIVSTQEWIHILSLMVLSVGVIILSIGFKVRALMYVGSAFLAADMVAVIVKGGSYNPVMIWITGIGLGILVIALGAYCERHRELLLQRLNRLSSALSSWD